MQTKRIVDVIKSEGIRTEEEISSNKGILSCKEEGISIEFTNAKDHICMHFMHGGETVIIVPVKPRVPSIRKFIRAGKSIIDISTLNKNYSD